MLFPLRCLAALALIASGAQADADADRDGIPDSFEDAVLARFLPQFHISATDCDSAPAEFTRGSAMPAVKAKNGTIYGQVTWLDDRSAIEIHYFHLWSKDCGPPGHALDAEAIAARIQAVIPGWDPLGWKATHWYASAHQNTLCDMSNGALAESLHATDRGPTVWISRDKHASFLSKALCKLGCGRDDCEGTKHLTIAGVVNLGEQQAVRNGSEWVNSEAWQLAPKMKPYFTRSLLARMPATGAAVMPGRDVVIGMRTTIKIAGNTHRSLEAAQAGTEAGVASAAEGAGTGVTAAAGGTVKSAREVKRAIKTSAVKTGRSLKRSVQWLGLRE